MSPGPRKTPKKPRASIRRDAVHPADYRRYATRFACEDCTHFKRSDETCTIGYWPKWHRRDFQKEEYERAGRLAFCRFIEID